jgi:hypothetical protein
MSHNLFRDRRRYQLQLGKFPIVEIKDRLIVIRVSDSPPLFFRTIVPPGADVRVGDVLSLYTEVLQKAN